MSTVPERNILSMAPSKKQRPPIEEITIPTVPLPEVLPFSFEHISANENLLMLGIGINFFILFIIT
jgi:hypothetical protein